VSKIIKSRKRVKIFGKVLTPPNLVEKILELLPPETHEPYINVLEPACGEGIPRVCLEAQARDS
jgi:type I restriction-modification system DNA methylase subunit